MVDKFCRLCAKEKVKGIGIYDIEGVKLNLSSKINRCLQIKLYPGDLLPKMVCVDCCHKLEQSFEFFESSSQAQRILQETTEPRKEHTTNEFSQLQNPHDAKDFVECILFGNSNEHDLPIALESDERCNNGESKVKRRKKYEREVKDDEGCVSDFDNQGEVEGKLKRRKTLQRVKLEDCYTWQCTDCPTILISLQELKEHHSEIHSQSVRFQCVQCAKVYTVYKKFTRHVRLHRNHGKYSCEDCGKAFSSKQAMENHAVLHSGDRPHVCPDCGKTFRQVGSLYCHRRIHQTDDSAFTCPDCGKLLLSRQSLELHIKSHSGARDYTCDICGKSFAVKQGLVYHMMSHSGERPHCCQQCGKRCKTVYLLNKHVATHSDVKAHQCDVCGKQFRESSTLKLHTRIHTGVMPYRCEFCGRQFRFQGVYVIHRRQHTGERPYSCNECKRDFTNWANYNKHMKCRHSVKPKTTLPPDKDEFGSVSDKQCPASVTGTMSVKPHDVTFEEDSAATVRLDKMIGSLCSLQDGSNQYCSSHLYSHIASSAAAVPGYYFPSSVNHEYGLPD